MDQARHANWARALTDENAFRIEQERLGQVWTLLGVAPDVARDGDWFRATLGGRSVFVQRFGDALRGFENVCVHRFFPLRTEDKGNGPVVCGYHHWRYNQDGLALGIPICPEVFGVEPRALNARLNPVEIATCGDLIFGRFPPAQAGETLEKFLGEGEPLLKALCTIPGKAHTISQEVVASWRLLYHITLDDYHIVAVHHNEHYYKNSDIRNFRFGDHHAHFTGKDDDTLASMAAQLATGDYRPSEYRIFHIFPNLLVSLFCAQPYWYVFVQQFVPLSARRSFWRGWFFNTWLTTKPESAYERASRPLSELFRVPIVRHYIKKIADQDHRACEKQQTIAHQIDGWPLFGSQEVRVEWFEDSYMRTVGPGPH